MTRRGIIIGLLIAVLLSAFCFFHDGVIGRGERMVGDLMPAGVWGPILLVLLVANPLLKRLRPTWVLSARELAIIACAALLAGSVASRALVRMFPTSIMLPHHYMRTNPSWAKEDVVGAMPKRMLPDISHEQDIVLDGYVTGLGEGDVHIAPSAVPWHAWIGALTFWVPLFITVLCASIALAVVVHRQWVHHEHLPFPTVTFASAVFPSGNHAWGSALHQRLFWVSATAVTLIHVNNYLARLWPRTLIPVKLSFDLRALMPAFDILVRGGGQRLFQPSLMFAVIGLSYFIASDVSFSMGAMPFIFVAIAGWFAGYGVIFYTGNHLSPNLTSFLFAGGYFGLFLLILYTGRRYYSAVLRAGLGLKVSDGVEAHVVWAMRLFLASALLFVVQLMAVGLSPTLAVVYVGLALMTWLVVSRVVAETGAYYIGTQIFPGGLLWGVMGATALGVHSVAIVYLVTACILCCPGWSTMPFAVQGFRLAEVSGETIGRMAKWSLGVVLICLCVAVPVTLYLQYDRGAIATAGGWMLALSHFPGDNIVEMTQQLRAQGSLEISESLSGWGRLLHMRPQWHLVAAFAAALSLALTFAFCRLRFARWPFHPVVLVFMHGGQAVTMAWSFLIGCAIKASVTHYGGARLYDRVKPLMIGLIAGDLVGRFIPMGVGIVHYLATGRQLI